MFKSLRDKLKGWTEKFSKAKEEEVEEPEETEKIIEKPEKEKTRKEEKVKKTKLTKEEKRAEKEAEKKSRGEEKKKKEEEKQEKKKKEKEEREEKGKEKKPEKKSKISEKEVEVEMPTKFNVGAEKFEPDYEKLKEKIEELEEEKEASKPGTKSFFKRITSGAGKVKISEKDFDEYKEDLEMLLLENNVAFEVSDEIIKKLKEKIVGKEILKKEMEIEIKDALREIISDILVEPFDVIKKILDKKEKHEPFVILFFGINGSGKTTTIAKISEYLRRHELSTVMAAGDTFRAASIEQLKEHGSKIGIKVIAHEYGSDPASVGFDAIQYAKKNRIDCVLIDTAGRMHTEVNLIKEMEKINRVCKPDLKIFIGESITGNDATEQARAFNEKIGIDGITLTKADIDEKGGTALSVGFVTKKPIIFLGMGQEYKDIEYFDKNKFLDKLGLE